MAPSAVSALGTPEQGSCATQPLLQVATTGHGLQLVPVRLRLVGKGNTEENQKSLPSEAMLPASMRHRLHQSLKSIRRIDQTLSRHCRHYRRIGFLAFLYIFTLTVPHSTAVQLVYPTNNAKNGTTCQRPVLFPPKKVLVGPW